jgi:hypothetical protein
VSRWMRWVADQERWAQVTLGVVGLVVLAAVIGAAWWAYF